MQPVEILDTYFPKRHITDILAANSRPLTSCKLFFGQKIKGIPTEILNSMKIEEVKNAIFTI